MGGGDVAQSATRDYRILTASPYRILAACDFQLQCATLVARASSKICSACWAFQIILVLKSAPQISRNIPFPIRAQSTVHSCLDGAGAAILLHGGGARTIVTDAHTRPRMLKHAAGRVLEALGGRDAGFGRGRLAQSAAADCGETGVISENFARWRGKVLGRRPSAAARRAPRRWASRLQPRVRGGTWRDPQRRRRPRPGSGRRGGRASQRRRWLRFFLAPKYMTNCSYKHTFSPPHLIYLLYPTSSQHILNSSYH